MLVAAVGGKVFAGADAGLFTSTDGGATWNAAGVTASVYAFAEIPGGGSLFAGTLAGVFESVDAGASWASAGEGLGNPSVLSLALLPDGTLLAGTNGGSVFELVGAAEREPVARVGGRPGTRVLPARP